MRTELTQIEKIERYIENQMSPEEQQSFENELASNQDLQTQFEQFQLLKRAVIRQALKNDIQQFAPKAKFKFAKWTAVLGTVFLALTLVYWFTAENNVAAIQENLVSEIQKNDSEPTDNPAIADKTSSPEASSKSQNNATRKPAKIKSSRPEKFDGLQTWLEPEIQRFTIDTKQGATLEGKDGTLIIVPTDAFVDQNGKVIDDRVELEVVEALKMSDMIAYNLATVSNGKPLSSGGMLYIQPYADGEKIDINPNRPLYIEIPTDDYNSEMQSWRGVTDNNGDINWENPQDLQKFLVRIDLDQLDFLPPGFENAVHANMPFRNHKTADKRLVDSLYYGLFDYSVIDISNFWNNEETTLIPPINLNEAKFGRSGKFKLLNYFRINKRKKNIKASNDWKSNSRIIKDPKQFCYINPLSVSTLKTQEFSNTFIATKEFEDRLRALHGIAKSDSLMDLYVNNLAKDLWEVDALVAQRLQGEERKIFENFAAQRCTNLKDADIHQERLSSYYATKREALADENKKANALYQKKNAQELQTLAGVLSEMKGKLNQLNEQKATNASQMDVYNRVNESNSGASDKKQIPAFIPLVNNVVRSSNVYATPWFDAGWMNIDMYLKDINKNAVDVEFVASFSADQPAHFKIYQCLNTLKTLVPLNVNNNKALAKFPSKNSKASQAMTDTYAIGLQWKNDGSLALAEHQFNPYKTKSIDLQWEEISQAELSKRLKKLDYATDLLKHIEKQEKLILEAQRIKAETALMQEQIQQTKLKFEEKQKAIIAEIEFMKMLQRSIDVCEKSSQSKSEQSTQLKDELATVPLTRPEIEPQFPGGEQAMLFFINNNFNIPSELVIEDPKSKIYVQFFVEVDGSITEIRVVRGIHPLLDAEAIRVVSIMPKFIPAQNKGVPVRQSLVLPITLHLK